MSTTAIFGSYVLSRKDGAQDVLRDRWVLVEGKTIAAMVLPSIRTQWSRKTSCAPSLRDST